MRKLLIVTLALFLAILVGCGGTTTGETGETQDPVATVKPSGTPTLEPSDKPKEKPSEKIEVDKNLLSVEITLPASMFGEQDMEQVIKSAKEDGVEDAKVNEDGSVTYKMSKSAHKKIMKEMESGAVEYIEELKTSTEYASIKDVKYNDKMTEFDLIVDKAKFEGSFDGFVAMGLGFQGMFYQAFDGVKEPKTTIQIKDEATGDIIKTVVYPDDMK